MAYRILAALFAALFAAPALAQVPSTLPANSVVGRLGVTAGKPQAIPFDTLFSAANIQPVTANLTALLALGSTGFPTRTGADTWAQRSVAGTANEITVTNGNGVSGNPTISLPPAIILTGKITTGGMFIGGAFNGTGTFTSLSAQINQNAATTVTATNTSTGAAGQTAFQAFNSGSKAEFGILSTGFTPVGVLAANRGYAFSNSAAGFAILAAPGPIVFGSGSTAEAARFDTSGNLGIGTASPAAQLHTTGTIRFAGLAGLGTGCPTIDNSGNLTGVGACSGGAGFPAGGVKGDLPYYSAPNTGSAVKASAANIQAQGGDASGAATSSAAAVLAYGYSKRIVLPPAAGGATGTYKFSSNVTFPVGTDLIVPCGVTLAPDGGITVTNNGRTIAGQCTIVSGSGTVYLGRDVNIDWWPSTGSDDALAFNAADASLTTAAANSADGYESIIRLGCKAYTAKTALILHPTSTLNPHVVGCGNTVSGFTGTSGGTFARGIFTVVGQTSGNTQFRLRDFYIQSQSVNQAVQCLTLGTARTQLQGVSESDIDSLYLTNCNVLIGLYYARNLVFRNMALWMPNDASAIGLLVADNGGGDFGGDVTFYDGQFVSGTSTAGGVGDCVQINKLRGSSFTGSIAGTTLTAGVPAYGTIQVGDPVTGTGITAGTYVSALGSGTGGAGTYTVSASQTVASTTMTIAQSVAASFKFHAVDFYYCGHGINGTVAGTGVINDIWFINSSFDGLMGGVALFTGAGVQAEAMKNFHFDGNYIYGESGQPTFKFNGVTSSEIKEVSIRNNRARSNSGSNSSFAEMVNVLGASVNNNQIAAFAGAASSVGQLINAFNSNHVTVTGNTCVPDGIANGIPYLVTASGTTQYVTVVGNNCGQAVLAAFNNASAGATGVSAGNTP
jgi:hypothetical protein